MAHPEQRLSVTGRGLCVAARLFPDSRVSASAAVFSLGVGIEEKISAKEGGQMHISHPGYACFESMPSKLVFVVFDVFGSRSFVC